MTRAVSDDQARRLAGAVDRWRSSLEDAAHGVFDQLYTADALFDVNVPEWRFQLRGPDAIARQFDEWHPQPPRLVEWLARSVPWGEVVELALWEGEGHSLYSRSAHLFELDGGRIARHTMYCTGDVTADVFDKWNAGLIVPAR